MKVLVTGASGQLGHALRQSPPAGISITACSREDLDITDSSAVRNRVEAIEPDWIINAAAYTDVEGAESEPEKAFAVNAEGAGNLAKAAQAVKARLIHVSTDYVFDGTQSHPYRPEDRANPINVYGESKYSGEQGVLEESNGTAVVVRSSWLYDGHHRNFVTKMLELMSERDEVKVVADQVGSPTSTLSLARCIWKIVHADADIAGILHWADAGVASWYDLACMTYHYTLLSGRLRDTVRIVPVGSEDFPSKARRPNYSVLDMRGTADLIDELPEFWAAALRKELDRHNHAVDSA